MLATVTKVLSLIEQEPPKEAVGAIEANSTLVQMVSSALWVGLFACIAAMLYGGATWALGGIGGNSGGQSRGKTYVMCGAMGAIAVGLGPKLIEGFARAAGIAL